MEIMAYTVTGEQTKTVQLNDAVFGQEINQDVIYYAMRNEAANKRIGTACTKDRGEVNGSTAKRWRQKGTGRARSGSVKSPLVVGGGTVFGPKPRDYHYTIPKKTKRLAIKSLLSMKLKENNIKFIEPIVLQNAKTKELADKLKTFTDKHKTVLITHDEDAVIKRAAANIYWLTVMSFKRLNIQNLFYADHILIVHNCVEELENLLK